MVKIMVTNGGPHPADKWAETTADEILSLIQIDDNSDSIEAMNARIGKRDLSGKLFTYFFSHHKAVQGEERKALKKDGTKHADGPLDPVKHLKGGAEALDPDLAEIFETSPFADHFRKPEVIAVVNTIIAQHSGDVMNIERRWHTDRQVSKGT